VVKNWKGREVHILEERRKGILKKAEED